MKLKDAITTLNTRCPGNQPPVPQSEHALCADLVSQGPLMLLAPMPCSLIIAVGEIWLLLWQYALSTYAQAQTCPRFSKWVSSSSEWRRAILIHNSKETIRVLFPENCALVGHACPPWHGQRSHIWDLSVPQNLGLTYLRLDYKGNYPFPQSDLCPRWLAVGVPSPSREASPLPHSRKYSVATWPRKTNSKSSDILTGPKLNVSSMLSMLSLLQV